MASGVMPTYGYVPPARPDVDAQLRTCSSRLARLWAGGTYFRSRDLGLQQNKISVAVVEHAAPTSGTPDGVCIVTNYNIERAENVVSGLSQFSQASRSQYSSFWKLVISFSLSTTMRVATDCTRPAERPRRIFFHSRGESL